jgi:hypothetical protein
VLRHGCYGQRARMNWLWAVCGRSTRWSPRSQWTGAWHNFTATSPLAFTLPTPDFVGQSPGTSLFSWNTLIVENPQWKCSFVSIFRNLWPPPKLPIQKKRHGHKAAPLRLSAVAVSLRLCIHNMLSRCKKWVPHPGVDSQTKDIPIVIS